MTDQVSFPELARQIGEAFRTVLDGIQPRLMEAALSAIMASTWARRDLTCLSGD